MHASTRSLTHSFVLSMVTNNTTTISQNQRCSPNTLPIKASSSGYERKSVLRSKSCILTDILFCDIEVDEEEKRLYQVRAKRLTCISSNIFHDHRRTRGEYIGIEPKSLSPADSQLQEQQEPADSQEDEESTAAATGLPANSKRRASGTRSVDSRRGSFPTQANIVAFSAAAMLLSSSFLP